MKQQRFKGETQKYSLGESGPFRVHYKNCQKITNFSLKDKWTLRQNAKYAAFVLKYQNLLNDKPSNKLWTVYKQMAEFIKSRNFRQCKSHHEKLLSEYKQISNVVCSLKKLNPLFQIFLDQEKKTLLFYLNKGFQKRKIKQGELPDKSIKTSDQYLLQRKGQIRAQILNNEAIIKNEWIVCHQLFLEWTSRLRQLMIDPQNN